VVEREGAECASASSSRAWRCTTTRQDCRYRDTLHTYTQEQQAFTCPGDGGGVGQLSVVSEQRERAGIVLHRVSRRGGDACAVLCCAWADAHTN
jgi:hypothetical protein